MIHTFKFNNEYFAYDVFTSTLLRVDEATAHVMEHYLTSTKEEILERFSALFPVSEIEEILSELDQLKESGMIGAQIDYADVEPEHTGHVKAMCLHIAHDCNLRCKYCFASTGAFGGKRMLMDADVGCKALDFLFANSGQINNLEVDFFGGEPLMNLDAVKTIVDHGRALEKQYGKTVNFTLTTNAYEMDEDTMRYLDREMHNVVISIDGRPEIHDYMRPTIARTGSQQGILDNAKHFVEIRGDRSHYIRGTFTRHNLDFMKDVQYLHEQGFKQISIEPVVADERTSYALNESHLDAIRDEYDRLALWYLEQRKNGRWLNFFHFFVDLENGPCATKRLSGCGAGCEYIAVTPEGDIYPCHQFTGDTAFKLGTLDDGFTNSSVRDDFACNAVSAKEECRNCWAQFWCGGGCAANAHAFNQSIHKPHELECEMQRKRLECALAIYAIEHDEG